MIYVFFQAGVGTFKVRAIHARVGQEACVYTLKVNIPTRERAIRYAQQWIRHTGSKIEASELVEVCVPAHRRDVEIIPYVMVRGICANGTRLDEAGRSAQDNYAGRYVDLAHVLHTLGSSLDARSLMKQLEYRPYNIFLCCALDRLRAFYERLSEENAAFNKWHENRIPQ